MEIPVWSLVAMTSGLLTIGAFLGSAASKFVTRVEFRESLGEIHKRIDQIFHKLSE
jgi:hypothetical protein